MPTGLQMPPTLIRTKNLGKTYSEGSTDVHALRDVDLEIEEGGFTVLMGSSGSGKSTLLYLLGGLETPSGGEIHFCDDRLDTMDETELSLVRRTGIGFVFPAINLVAHLSIFENVVVPGYLVERDRRVVDSRAMALLESMGIADLADRLPAQVSGGEQQRAGIARAMVNSPRALFADEPTGALNSAAGKVVLDSLRRVNAGGQTILMATHEVKAACIGDRILYLRDGEIRSEYRLDAHSSLSDGDREADVLAWLSAQGW
jgi:putative ABC transport system ATP-binding protein